ncbi:MAG: hypothetical protein JJE55_09390 [Flavobacteriaceae bacterium]|nr:hypothetical protein [Flavobacteriaceae bacterium]
MTKNTEPIPKNSMIEAALDFWFNDQGHIRSPFPTPIRKTLEEKTKTKFSDWTAKLSDGAKKEINDEIIAEKYEEILFETASELVSTEDEKLTILYPFMPRIGDIINPKDASTNGESEIIGRNHIKRGDDSFLKVKLKSIGSGKEWETEFELPE